MKRKWILKNSIPEDFYKQHDLQKSLLAVLYNRGLTEKDDIQAFLNPEYDLGMHNPFLMPDMEAGVERTLQALSKGEKITVYADYDADAVTAATVMIRTLRELGGNVDYYIPDRFSEGYGMSVEGIAEIVKGGTKLIITVDCGITAVEEVKAANEAGVDTVITDHHHVPEELPPSIANINPQRKDNIYPCTHLTGVGVAFKFTQALLSRAGNKREHLPDGWEKWLLDIVAIGTVADCQALLDENRVLVKYGLVVMKKTKWPGLKALMSVAGTDSNKEINTGTIGFQLAPRINAAGRISHANIALELLLADDELKALDYANQLEQLNRKRQRLTETIMSEAREQVEAQAKNKNKILFARNFDWPKGIVGLVAGKLTEEFYRPVLVASQDKQEATGSARSIPSFNIVEAFEYASEHAVRFGGHAAAAGFTVLNDKLNDFYSTLCGFADVNLKKDDLDPVLWIDAELGEENDFTLDYARELEKLEPFGQNNPRPNFLIKDLEVIEVRTVGSNDKHAQLVLKHPNGSGLLKCIAFSHGYMAKALSPGEKIDMVAELNINTWNGNSSVQLRLIDWRKNE